MKDEGLTEADREWIRRWIGPRGPMAQRVLSISAERLLSSLQSTEAEVEKWKLRFKQEKEAYASLRLALRATEGDLGATEAEVERLRMRVDAALAAGQGCHDREERALARITELEEGLRRIAGHAQDGAHNGYEATCAAEMVWIAEDLLPESQTKGEDR